METLIEHRAMMLLCSSKSYNVAMGSSQTIMTIRHYGIRPCGHTPPGHPQCSIWKWNGNQATRISNPKMSIPKMSFAKMSTGCLLELFLENLYVLQGLRKLACISVQYLLYQYRLVLVRHSEWSLLVQFYNQHFVRHFDIRNQTFWGVRYF